MTGRHPVVVLGASGFIGRHVVAALAATDWAQPVAASRAIAGARFAPGIEKISLDATDQSRLERVLASARGVVSCIAGSPRDIARGGSALLAAAARAPAPIRVVYLSSIAAYGSVRGDVDETNPLLGDLGEYSAAKAAVEQLAARVPYVVRLRPGIVYGPESPWWSDRIARLLVQRRLGDLGSRGEGICNLVHVEDVAAAVLRALELPEAAGEAINLGSPAPPTWNEYFRRYARALGALPVRRISGARLRLELALCGPFLKLAEQACGDSNPWRAHPAIRPWLTALCRHDVRINVHKAERLLSMQWRPLEAGLEQTAAWFLAGGRTR